jgi:hypothetical protein
LRQHRVEKEFFRVSSELAKETIQRAYAELFPDAIKQIDAAVQARAHEMQQKREAALAQIQIERGEATRKRSDEYQWTLRGELHVPVLSEMREPTRGPNLLQRLFGPSVADNVDIELLGLKDRDRGERWRVILVGCIRGKDLCVYQDVPSAEAALAKVVDVLADVRPVTASCRMKIDVGLLDQPLEPEVGRVSTHGSKLCLTTPAPAAYRLIRGSLRDLDVIAALLRQRCGRTDANRPPLPVYRPVDPVPTNLSAPVGAFKYGSSGSEKRKYPWGSKEKARELLTRTMSGDEVEAYLAQFVD